ncbi:general transcription factor 3C polypeptide 1 [Neosynchiropus ocellatus]
MDALSVVEDEVALEGLDGITIPSLWIRLSNRKQPFALKLDDLTKGFIWRYLVSNTELKFYELPEERDDVLLFDRFTYEVVEVKRKEIYPLNIIVNNKDGLRGSCSTFNERKDVTREVRSEALSARLSLNEATERYGRKLVVVASQSLRLHALLGPETDPDVKLSDECYCILERVGRGRWQGEVQSDMHGSWFKLDARKFHYVRKPLIRHRLVVMQSYLIRQLVGQHKHSILLLLKRFYVNRRSKYDVLAERVSDLMSQMPFQFATFLCLRQQLRLNERTLKRVLCDLKESKCVQSCKLPLEDLDNEGGPCLTKKGNKVMVQGFKLIKPFESKCSMPEDEDDDEDDDEDVGGKRSVIPAAGRFMEMDLISQSYYYILSCGTKGITKSYVGAKMNIGKLESRMICRRLEKDGLIKGFMEDVGRQRITKYISHNCVGGSDHLQQFAKEQERQKLLCSDIQTSPDVTRKLGGKSEKTPAAKKPKKPTKKETPRPSADEEPDVPKKTVKTPKKKQDPEEQETGVTAVECEASSTNDSKQNQAESRSEDTEEEKELLPASETVKEDSNPAGSLVTNALDSISETLSKAAKKSLDKSKETYRVLRRKNIIIEAVQSLKIVEGVFPLQKMVNEAERLDGCSSTCCKKTVTRLVMTLAREGLLKIYSTTVIQDGITKKIDMVVHPSIQQNDPLVQSVIEQVRFRISGVTTAARAQAEEDASNKEYSEMTGCVFKSQKCMGSKKQEGTKEEAFKPTRVPGLGRSLGFQPKMHRLHIVHAFLWYVVYGQKAESGSNSEDSPAENESLERTQLEASDSATLESAPAEDSELQRHLVPSPKKEEEEESWKKFIPPLRSHKGYSRGWAMISDLLLCMPLSVFIQIIQINYSVEGLEEYVNDPVRQHHLIRDLPSQMRRQLLYKRKYIFSFHENLQKLTYMGLLQFGPNGKFNDKDHVFVYLNRNATIVDTTSSEPHYWLVSESPDKPFEKRHYQFNTFQDVENYWFDLMCVCLNTPLGVIRQQRCENETSPSFYNDRNVFIGMAHLLKGSLEVSDDASTPGDGKGAGGLDSEFFSHLKRNWLWTNHLLSDKKSSTAAQSKIRLKSLMSKNFLHLATKAGSSTNPCYITPKKPVVRVEDVEVVSEPASRNQQVVGGKHQKRKRVKKEVVKPPRKRKKEARKRLPAHDEIDHKALKMMTRQRVIWKLQEDSVILLGNVASHLLNSKLKKPFIWYCVLRDMLHAELAYSLDKTSLAVGRRSRYILKNPQTLLNYRICLAEVHQDKALMQQLEENIPADPNNSDDCAKVFAEYIRLLRLKFSSFNSSCQADRTFDTKEQLFSKFRVCTIENKSKAPLKEVIKSTSDIHAIVLQNLIQSTLSMNNFQMRSLRSFQTFHMYSQYNQELLCQVFLQCRKKGLVNRRRVGKLPGAPKKNRALPILPMSYQLSQTYYRTFSWRFPHSLCSDCFRLFKGLSKHESRDDRRSLSFYHETALRTQDVEVMLKSKGDGKDCRQEAATLDAPVTEERGEKGETQPTTEAGEDAPVGKQVDDSHPEELQGGSEEPEPPDMLLYSMDSPGGSCLAALSLMSLGWVSLHLSVPRQMVVVDSQLVDKDVVRSMNVLEDDDNDEDDRDECVGKKMEVKAHQASHTKYLMMQGYCSPGIVKNRNLNTNDSIVVESCIIRLQLRNTPSHQVFLQDDFRPSSFSKTGPSLLPPSLTQFVLPCHCPSSQEWERNLVDKGYSAQDVEACARLRSSLDDAGEKGIDEEDLLRVQARLLELQCGRTRTLHQYLKDMREDGQVLKVGGLYYRWVLMKHAEPWLLTIPSNKWQPQSEDPVKVRVPRKRSRREAVVQPDEPAPKRLAAGEEEGRKETLVQSEVSSEATKTDQQADPRGIAGDQESGSKSVDDHDNPEEKEAMNVEAEESHEEETAEEKTDGRTRLEDATAEPDENAKRFVGRPWRMTDGKLNRPVCKGMLEGVMQHIMSCPGVTLQTLLEYYKRVVQPVVLMELLQALVEMDCITRRTLVKKPKPSLFSRRSDPSERQVLLEKPDAVFYEPTISCCLRLGQVFPNERHWSYVTQ